MPKPGDLIDAYRIVTRLRSGGMAQLYLASKEGAAGFTRPVALKLIHPHLARERSFVDMFVSEARVCAAIDDPNVVKVEQLGETNGALYLAMEYIHGLSLGELIRHLQRAKVQVTHVVATYIACRIAAGLHAAHETTSIEGKPLGIVHRDVSPQNVLVGFNGHIKLIDFGIAKALDHSASSNNASAKEATGLSLLRGKPAYMAPEQAAGSRSVDRRADVFALGSILYELLTSQRLFDADNDFVLIERVKKCVVTSPRALLPSLPVALEAALMTALERDPNRRYATAEDFARALGHAVPEALQIEPSHIAALLRAIVPQEIENKRALLAEVQGLDSDLLVPDDDDDTTNNNDTHEVLRELTLPSIASDAWPAEEQAADRDRTTVVRRERSPLPRIDRALRGVLLVAIGMVIVVLGYWVLTRRTPATAEMPTAPITDPSGTAANPVASVEAELATADDAGIAIAQPNSGAGVQGRPARSARPTGSRGGAEPRRNVRAAGSASKPHADCKVIEGVELCQ